MVIYVNIFTVSIMSSITSDALLELQFTASCALQTATRAAPTSSISTLTSLQEKNNIMDHFLTLGVESPWVSDTYVVFSEPMDPEELFWITMKSSSIRWISERSGRSLQV